MNSLSLILRDIGGHLRHTIDVMAPWRPAASRGARVSLRAKIEGLPKNIHVAPGAKIREQAWLNCMDEESRIEIGSGTLIMPYAKLVAGFGGVLSIGARCSIHSFDVLYGFTGGLRIGNDVRIGTGVTFITSNHNFDDLTVPMARQGYTSKGVVIGDDAWIGAGAMILDGVTVGERAVIGAGSVVTRDVPADVVCAGVPARIVRRRGEKPPHKNQE